MVRPMHPCTHVPCVQTPHAHAHHTRDSAFTLICSFTHGIPAPFCPKTDIHATVVSCRSPSMIFLPWFVEQERCEVGEGDAEQHQACMLCGRWVTFREFWLIEWLPFTDSVRWHKFAHSGAQQRKHSLRHAWEQPRYAAGCGNTGPYKGLHSGCCHNFAHKRAQWPHHIHSCRHNRS